MDPNEVAISPQRTDATLTIALSGELDAANVEGLSDRILPLLAPTDRTVVLDLAGVTFCGSAGLSLFIRLHNAAERQGGEPILAGPTPAVLRTITLCHLDEVLTVAPSLPAPA